MFLMYPRFFFQHFTTLILFIFKTTCFVKTLLEIKCWNPFAAKIFLVFTISEQKLEIHVLALFLLLSERRPNFQFFKIHATTDTFYSFFWNIHCWETSSRNQRGPVLSFILSRRANLIYTTLTYGLDLCLWGEFKTRRKIFRKHNLRAPLIKTLV